MMFSGDDALKKVAVLSGGEKSRLLLGKLLLRPVHLLLLDEPTHHLDMESCETLKDAIRSFNGAVIMVTHDEMFLHTMANRFVVFDAGRVFQYHGSYQNFLKDIGWQEEKEDAQPTSTVLLSEPMPDASDPAKPDNRDLRQARAKILQEKSRLLKPLEAKIKSTELEISQIESTISQNENRLVEASIKSEKEILATLPKENKILANRRDTLYKELETCIRESDHIISACQAQLNAL
jgi:ATP-binding cassette, subfamily F, member 3